MSELTIIEAAINGGLSKRRNPAVPRTPDEVREDALACLAAGAAIVHNHTDDAVLGAAGEHDPAAYLTAWRGILAARPDALLYPTMPGGRPEVPVQRRYAHVEVLHAAGVLGLGLVDPGSTNFGRAAPDGVPRAETRTYVNTYQDAVHMTETCRRLGVGISVSIFEPGFLRFVLAYHRAGRLPPGVIVKLYFGGEDVLFGYPGQPLATAVAGLDAYLAMLEGTGLPWMVSIQGGDVVASGLAAEAIRRGGHLQVGLEPSGHPTATNRGLVEEAARLVRELGRTPASPREAAVLAGLPPRSPARGSG